MSNSYDPLMAAAGAASDISSQKKKSGAEWFCENIGVPVTEDNIIKINDFFCSEYSLKVCRFFTGAVGVPEDMLIYVLYDKWSNDLMRTSVKRFFSLAAPTFKAILSWDKNLCNMQEWFTRDTWDEVVSLGVKTLDELLERKDELSEKVKRNLYNITDDVRFIGGVIEGPATPILSCDNVVFIGKSGDSFLQIQCDVICISTLERGEIKKYMLDIRKVISDKLKKDRRFKNNEELLKHLKIANMYYNGKGILKVFLEWKESFAYDHLS